MPISTQHFLLEPTVRYFMRGPFIFVKDFLGINEAHNPKR